MAGRRVGHERHPRRVPHEPGRDVAAETEREDRDLAQAGERAVRLAGRRRLLPWGLCHDQSQSFPGCSLPLIHRERQ